MKRVLLFLALVILLGSYFTLHLASAAEQDIPMLKVGHVGHDHQLALYVAAEAGQSLKKNYGVWLKELKNEEVYDLYDSGRPVARLYLIKVGGGSKMPAALEQDHIEVGLGGFGPVVKFIDKGSPIKVLAPLNNDGDSMVLSNGIKASSWHEFIEYVKKSGRPVKVGYKDPMANAFMILSRALSEESISYGQEPVGKDGRPVRVITVNLQGEENALSSLESGIVDAVVANEPVPSILVAKKVGHRLADLSDLPPKGIWEGHPCCVVAASDKALAEKKGIIKSFLKAIAAGGDIILRDREKALNAESKWTRTSPEIGRSSIMNVSYVIRADEVWLKAVDRWIDLMISSGQLQKNLKGKSSSEIRAMVFDPGPLSEALSEIRLKSASVRGK